MTTQAQEATVRHEIVVEVSAERAFRVFTEQMDQIKPHEHNLLGVDIAEAVFEPRAGGRIYDRGTDGSECEWARVLAYEPPDRVVRLLGERQRLVEQAQPHERLPQRAEELGLQ